MYPPFQGRQNTGNKRRDQRGRLNTGQRGQTCTFDSWWGHTPECEGPGLSLGKATGTTGGTWAAGARQLAAASHTEVCAVARTGLSFNMLYLFHASDD